LHVLKSLVVVLLGERKTVNEQLLLLAQMAWKKIAT